MSNSHQDSTEPGWFKSSYSGGNATECVECAYAESGTLIRDSKDVEGPVITVGHDTWASFVQTIRGK